MSQSAAVCSWGSLRGDLFLHTGGHPCHGDSGILLFISVCIPVLQGTFVLAQSVDKIDAEGNCGRKQDQNPFQVGSV